MADLQNNRKKIIAGNWKMHRTASEAAHLIGEIAPLCLQHTGVDVLVCPPFTALHTAGMALRDSTLMLGAQDLFWKQQGAYTGEVSAPMLAELGVQYVLVGHSERRGRFGVPEPEMAGPLGAVFGDNDFTVNRKMLAAVESEITPIVCVGETLAERRAGTTDAVVSAQTAAALRGFAGAVSTLVMAYEPVWAIGTGEVCGAVEANRVCGVIRAAVGEQLGALAVQQVRIQYGGSVKPDNAAELLTQPHIDGALVGGASLNAVDFAAIVAAAGAASSL